MHSLFNSFRENIWDKGCRGLNIALLAALFVVPGFAKAQPTLESKLKMPATTVAATGQYGVVSSTTTGRHLANEVFFGNVYPDDEIEAIVSTQHDDRLGYSAFIVGKNGKKASISISDKLPAQANRLSRWNSSGLFRSIPGANPGDLDRVVAGLEDGFRIFKFNENNGLYEVDKSLVDYGEPNTPLVAGEHNGEKYFAANFTTGTYIFNDDFTLRAGPIMDGGSLIDHDALFWVNGELHGLIQGVYDKMDADGASVGWKDILPASSKASKKMVFSLDNSENNVRILTYNSIDASMSVVNPETLEAEQVYSVTGQTDAPPQITYINNIPHAIRSFDNNRVDILNLVDKSVSTINNGDAISSDIAVGTIDESEGSDVFFTNVSRSVWQLYDANSGLESSISNISQSNIGAPRGAHDMDNDGLYEVVVFNGSDISVVGYATVLPPPELLNFQGRDNPSFDEGIDFSWDIPPGAVLDSIGLYLNGNKVQNLSGDATSLTFSEGIQHNIPYSAQVASYMNGLATFSGTQNVMSFGETITPYQKGDVDKNNKIDIFDLLETLKILSGSSNPDPEQQYLADIDGNERVDIFDLLGLLRLLSSGASLN